MAQRTSIALLLLLAACSGGDGGNDDAPAGPTGWAILTPSGAPPAPRWGNTAVIDSGRLFVFGGADSVDGTPFNDLHQLDLGTHAWSAVTTAGTPPAPRHGHGAILDGQRILIFGGRQPLGGGAQTLFNDLWSLDLSTTPPAWSLLAPAGSPPSARFGHAMLHDAAGQRLVVFGGANGIGAPAFNDVWTLNLAGSPAWTPLSPAGTPPSARYLAASIVDSAANRIVVFGGFTTGGLTNDLWSLDLAAPAWSPLVAGGLSPSARYGGYAAYDAATQRLLHFGGATAPGGPTVNETWSLSLIGTASWSQPGFAGTPPSARYVGTASITGARVLYFGGTTAPFNPAAALSETFELRW